MKSFLKFVLVLFVTAAVLLTAAVPAFADVIWEPNDAFYEAHRFECTYVNRGYTLAGANGEVEIRTEPNGAVRTTLKNGGLRNISHTWSDGVNEWGYTEWGYDGSDNTQLNRDAGWVRMSDLKLIYDSEEFFKDHGDEIETVDPIELSFASVKLFAYPNAPESRAYVFDDMEEPFTFETVYIDEAGLRWGYVGYYYGIRQKWICIDEPLIEGTDEPEPEAETPGPSGISYQIPLLLAAVLVAAVVILTCVLVRRIPRRK